MDLNFPSFEKGTAPSLLNSAEAKKVKGFIEAWRNAKIQPADKDSISITEGNVLITYKTAEATSSSDSTGATELHYNDGGLEIDIDGSGINLTVISLAPSTQVFDFF